jgi:transcriptional regulator with XRE-family HTH domain
MAIKEKTAGDLLRERREAKGWNRNQLMVRSGVTATGIGNIEDGIGAPRLDTLQKLAAALGCSAKELVP